MKTNTNVNLNGGISGQTSITDFFRPSNQSGSSSQSQANFGLDARTSLASRPRQGGILPNSGGNPFPSNNSNNAMQGISSQVSNGMRTSENTGTDMTNNYAQTQMEGLENNGDIANIKKMVDMANGIFKIISESGKKSADMM